MIILVITIICASVFLFFKVIIKQPNSFWKITLPDVIQLLMVFSLIIGTYLTNNSINEQKNYNKNSLRPWLQVMIDSTTRKPIYYDNKGFLRIQYTITNKGQTPAFSVKSYLSLEFASIYPESVMLEQINADTNSKKITIYQGCSYNLISSQISLIGGYDLLAKNKTGEIISVTSGQAAIKTVKDLFDALEQTDTKFYIHIYTEYNDINNNKFTDRSSFFLRPIKTDSIYGLEIFLEACSQTRIQHKIKKSVYSK